MGKIAFVFPGQGSQYVGMGKDFYEALPACKEVYEAANKATGLDVAALCFEENDKINITEYTQIAMLTTELAILKAVQDKGIQADMTAGLSLGEYGALYTAGVMGMEDIFKVVRKRGLYMQEAVPTGGAMTAVLGLDNETIEKICAETEGNVSVANYNCPGQTVITGEEGAVAAAAQALSAAGAKRCIPLKVSGPFHSSMLQGAGKKLGDELANVTLQPMQIPYLTNVTADYVKDIAEVKELLERQVSSSVRWQQSVERMLADGVDTFIEIGPGKTLTGFLKKINKDMTAINIEKIEDLAKLDALFLWVVDLFDFEANMVKGMNRHLQGEDIILVACKRDLIPSSVGNEKIGQFIIKRLKEHGIFVSHNDIFPFIFFSFLSLGTNWVVKILFKKQYLCFQFHHQLLYNFHHLQNFHHYQFLFHQFL